MIHLQRQSKIAKLAGSRQCRLITAQRRTGACALLAPGRSFVTGFDRVIQQIYPLDFE